MRVTETIKRDQVLGNIQRNAQKLQDLQLEMATGQRINKPSDDPLGATMAQDLVTNISPTPSKSGRFHFLVGTLRN